MVCRSWRRILPLLAIVLMSCGSGEEPAVEPQMNQLAESYVKLVLAVGEHDDGYVDAYYGPAEWSAAAAGTETELSDLQIRAEELVRQVDALPILNQADSLLALRKSYLSAQLAAVAARVRMLRGEELPFDEESMALYGAVAPTNDAAYFEGVLEEIAAALPGSGPLEQRYNSWRSDFVIPPDALDTVFTVAIAACRDRTQQHMELPVGESFVVEYVTDKPWSGYNWYQGDLQSLIQVNTDLPIYVDRAIDLACHEGYPGHHTYNAMLEHHLVNGRGWVEYSIYPLYSPQSLIAEGSANYGIDIAFPGAEREAFEASELFPLAGIDPGRAAEYYRVQQLVSRLSYAGNEAARRYLNGAIDGDAAAAWLGRYSLMSPERARQRVRFIDAYRSYVINYNLGRDLVADWVAREAGAGADPAARWDVFARLLASPRLPGDLRNNR